MIIVDAYCHFGECRVYDTSDGEYDVIGALNSNKVSAVLLLPFPGAPNPVAVHDSIANLGVRYPGRIFGLVNCNPHVHRDLYHREVERCVRDLGFVGITLDTFGHAVNPNGQDGQTVFEAAREMGVPVIVHTGTGVPFASPTRILPRAKEYNDVKIVLAHAGAGYSIYDAYVVAKEAFNVYLETSGCRGDEIKWLIDELGPSRILFGSDRAVNQATELAKYRALGLYQFQQYQVLGQTATDLFGLHGISDVSEVPPTPIVEAISEPAMTQTAEPAIESTIEAPTKAEIETSRSADEVTAGTAEGTARAGEPTLAASHQPHKVVEESSETVTESPETVTESHGTTAEHAAEETPKVESPA